MKWDAKVEWTEETEGRRKNVSLMEALHQDERELPETTDIWAALWLSDDKEVRRIKICKARGKISRRERDMRGGRKEKEKEKEKTKNNRVGGVGREWKGLLSLLLDLLEAKSIVSLIDLSVFVLRCSGKVDCFILCICAPSCRSVQKHLIYFSSIWCTACHWRSFSKP